MGPGPVRGERDGYIANVIAIVIQSCQRLVACSLSLVGDPRRASRLAYTNSNSRMRRNKRFGRKALKVW
jgi:hypothetical protein